MTVLLTTLFLGVVQVALILHVRTTLIDAAGEGARYGALAGRNPSDGAGRAAVLIEQALSPAYASDVSATVLDVAGVPDGAPGSRMVVVSVRAPLPVVGLVGPRTLDVSGRALQEAP